MTELKDRKSKVTFTTKQQLDFTKLMVNKALAGNKYSCRKEQVNQLMKRNTEMVNEWQKRNNHPFRIKQGIYVSSEAATGLTGLEVVPENQGQAK